ncbi:protein of unknown function [Streptococcus sanguinis]|uniref:Uncharacterized protein n=1 Tax=Streptococcus sanguinis TaxID=1305 RepID=A0A0B7GM08_STRSA|nr:protein of unknown function [Streptococcus sanguinis]
MNKENEAGTIVSKPHFLYLNMFQAAVKFFLFISLFRNRISEYNL